MPSALEGPRNPTSLLARFEVPNITIRRERDETIYVQGDPADAIFWLQDGHVKLSIVSDEGKQAVIAIIGPGDFFGEGCLASQPLRNASATAVNKCLISRVGKDDMARSLKTQPALCEFFLSQILSHKIHLEADLADQLCNSCERRLARTLLLLTRFDQSTESPTLVPKISQETLAAMVGTTQPRISFLLHKFKEEGLIQQNGGLRVNSLLLKLMLRDRNQSAENCDELSNFE